MRQTSISHKNNNNEECNTVKAASKSSKLTALERRVHRLQSVLERYRHALAVRKALLSLSELASQLSDMTEFYPQIHQLVQQYLVADNFYVVLIDHDTASYQVSYYADEKDPFDFADDADEFARGLTGRVARTGLPLSCDEHMYQQLIAQGHIEAQGTPSHHWMGVPLKRGSHVIGVMAVQLYDPHYSYQPQDMQLLEFIAMHTVTAIDRVKSRELLEQTVRERTRQLQSTNQNLQREIRERQNAEKLQAALYKIAELTASSADMSTFYRQIHQVLTGLMPAENCFIALLDESGKKLSFPFYVDQFSPPAAERPLRKGFTEYVLRVGEARLINKELTAQLVAQGEVLRLVKDEQDRTIHWSSSWLGAPLLIDQQALGVIALQSYDDSYLYGENELNILKFVSQHIAVAIQRKLNIEQQRQHQEELERKIFERTRELRQTNLFLRLQVEERKKAEEKLFHEANHDALTGLANRQMFMLQLRQKFALRTRQPDLKFSLLFIDLDRFKMINDTMGHHAGDAFLVEISHRLQQTVRELDLVARLGGDEFVVMLGPMQDENDAEDVAERIIATVREPMELLGQLVYSGASIGIAHYRNEYPSADALLRDADAAMYQAKAMGRNRFVIFTESMREQLLQEMSFEQSLHQALSEQQFSVRQQPIICTEKQHLLGYSAELCWQHPTLGCQTDFCHQAAQAGVLPQIEFQVLSQQLNVLQNSAEPAILLFPLSTQQLCSSNQLDKLHKLLQKHAAVLHRLALTFSEAELLKLNSRELAGLTSLKRAGVRLALDQFGANFMPLGLLTQYPFDFVKLEAGFCRSLVKQEQKRTVLELLLDLAQSYRFRLIADGVQDEQQLSTLLDIGCCYLQGPVADQFIQQQQASSAESTVLLQHRA